MTSSNGLKSNYESLKLTLVYICNSLKRLENQPKVLTSYKIIRLILQPLTFHYIYIYNISAKEILVLEKVLGFASTASHFNRLIYDKIMWNFLEKWDTNGTLEMKYHKAMRR